MRTGSNRPADAFRWSRAALALTPIAAVCGSAADAPADCRAWFRRSSAGSVPSARGEYGMAWDSDRARTVLFGGASNLGFTAVNKELWEWDGHAWSQVAFTGGPGQRCDHVQAYDPDRAVLVIYGGFNGSYLTDAWEWDGAEWTSQPNGPGARADGFMVYDTVNQMMVLFGGQAPGPNNLSDTWVRFGPLWAPQVPPDHPSARWIHRMAFDSGRAVAVLFGGAAAGNVVHGDTWEWNGFEWANPATSGASPRYGAAMAYDPHRQVTLMFGGQNGAALGTGLLGDTWEWNGQAWTQIQVPGPTPRSFVKMAYDAPRRRAVLFGGYTSAGFVDDTWEFGVYADCNTDGQFTVADFGCFQTHFVAGDPYADCNADGALTVQDFGCFQTRFVTGCP